MGCSRKPGIRNAYFPLFIPLSYLAKEAEHVEGFAKECAVVTHHRLEADGTGGLRPAPAAELTEPLVVRPTSETIIGASYAKWVQSYRDLPILINQWANVVRWEMRPRLFLRTAEFLWQEGHTAHETEAGSARRDRADAARLRNLRARLPRAARLHRREERRRALPRRGADALHRGHGAGSQSDPGRHVALPRTELRARRAASNFVSRENKQEFAWTTSWGVSTRLIGTVIMAHGDDDGVDPAAAHRARADRHPARHAEARDARRRARRGATNSLRKLRAQTFAGEPIRVEVDKRDLGGGTKNWEWIKKGRAAARRDRSARSREGERRRRAPRSWAEGKGISADRPSSSATLPAILAGDPGRAARPRHRAPRRSTP